MPNIPEAPVLSGACNAGDQLSSQNSLDEVLNMTLKLNMGGS